MRTVALMVAWLVGQKAPSAIRCIKTECVEDVSLGPFGVRKYLAP